MRPEGYFMIGSAWTLLLLLFTMLNWPTPIGYVIVASMIYLLATLGIAAWIQESNR